MKKYISYLRVSTKMQGQSGLGLEAQRSIINNYIQPDSIVEEFIEIESGRNNNRPQLQAAIKAVKSNPDYILIVAKIDRLARNVSFITALYESNINIVAVDLPELNILTLSIFAAIAQREAELTSERTKAALAVLKRQGKTLGTPANLTKEAIKKGNEARHQNALDNAENRRAIAIINLLRSQKKSLQSIADYLNTNGFCTSKGSKYYPSSVSNLINLYR